MKSESEPFNPLRRALRANRAALIGVGVFSAMLNVLLLTAPLFMIQVYDRVLPSHSIPTLVGLAVLAAMLYMFQGLFDILRGRVLVRIAGSFDELTAGYVLSANVRLPSQAGELSASLQPLRHLDQIRAFLSGAGPSALFDLPWMPLYLAICFSFHPLIGAAAAIGAVVLIFVTLLTEFTARRPNEVASKLGAERQILAEMGRRNADAILAMGMLSNLVDPWNDLSNRFVRAQGRAADVIGGMGAVSRTFRFFLQSGVLALGAYLVVNQQATGGIMIASSILTSRTLAPVEAAIANWRGFLAARDSWKRLSRISALLPPQTDSLKLPRPRQSLAIETVSATAPNSQQVLIRDVSLRLTAGQALAIIGPSGSGKSSLARAIVGAIPLARGVVRLDGASIDQLPNEARARDIGYLPQSVELISGTIAQNIARFDPNAQPEDIVAAAMAAGVHELILALPDGYESKVGEDGHSLSAGQRQRIALARALYRDPFLVVLDEPNSNLDSEGDARLNEAIAGVSARGGIVIIVAHRPGVLANVDAVLAMSGGRGAAFGPRDVVLKKITAASAPPSPPPTAVLPANSDREVAN